MLFQEPIAKVEAMTNGPERSGEGAATLSNRTFLDRVTIGFASLEHHTPRILGSVQRILVEIVLFAIFVYGLWRLLADLLKPHL